ncbi:MAG: peptidase S14 [Rhizobiales bacterium 32-66-8]|jgi:ATP-dependent protease ClpP protease subunit|nr:MAG: peptidase S14 [Rhizobiales bacterium 32-66-8]
MAAILDGGRLRLSGYVGGEYFQDGFTASDIVMAFAQVEEDSDLDIHLNSYGGIATEGSAIHALIKQRPGRTNIVVDGIAASAASLIAMAGETVTMSAGAVMMIHDPATFAFGPAADLLKAVDQLEALGTSYARLYADKSGQGAEACREIMKAETWFTAEEAVEAGFADATSTETTAPVAAFDYRAFAHAPKRLVALARQKKWVIEAHTPRHIKESSMTDKPNGGVDTAELERLRSENAALTAAATDRERRDAVLALPEAKGREALAQVLAEAGLTAEKAKAALVVAGTSPADENADLPDPQAYERGRVTAAGLTGKPPAGKGDITVLAAAVARTNKRR